MTTGVVPMLEPMFPGSNTELMQLSRIGIYTHHGE